MAARKKPNAASRTIDLFTKKTPLEEIEDQVREEAAATREPSKNATPEDPTGMVGDAEDAAIRWLGLDAFHEGDDIKVALHPAGHAVLVLVHTTDTGTPRATVTLKLSRTQWQKLRSICSSP